jgi:hypothetical protein
LQSAGFDLSDVEIDHARGQVFVADRDFMVPGVRVLRAGTCTQLTMSPISLGLPPYDIALAAATPTSTPPPAPTALSIANRPDPFNPATSLRVEAPASEVARIEIIDLRGRVIRSLWRGPWPGGHRELEWNGRDEQGNALPSGIYWARVQAGGLSRTDRLTLVR